MATALEESIVEYRWIRLISALQASTAFFRPDIADSMRPLPASIIAGISVYLHVISVWNPVPDVGGE